MKNKKFLFSLLSIFFFVSCQITVDDGRYLYMASNPTKTVFNVDEAFTTEGLTVIGMPSGKEVSDYQSSIEEGYVFLQSDIGENKKVTISAKNYRSVSYTIDVVNLPKLIIAHEGKTDFEYGEYFSFGDLLVTNMGGLDLTNRINSNYSSSTLLDKVGTFTVTISIDGYCSTSYQITVHSEKQLYVSTKPAKINYEQGEPFTSEGLVIKDENGLEITEYELSIKDGWLMKSYGDIEIIVSKPGYFDTSFQVHADRSGSTSGVNREVNIYYLNDTHGAFIRQRVNSYYGEGGLAYIGRYIKEKVAYDERSGNVPIVLSGGDMFQGGIESNLTDGMIVADAMNIIGFDAMVLGNHEFDWGEEKLIALAQKLEFPVLASNVFYQNTDQRPYYLKPFTVVEKLGVRVGIIGAQKEDLGTSITGSISDAFYFPKPISYVKEYSNLLRKSYNCDLVIAGFHDAGYDVKEESTPSMYSALTEISPQTGQKYVDAMFFAHDHYEKQGELNDVPYLESACNGENIGHMTFKVTSDSEFHYIKQEYSYFNLDAYYDISSYSYDQEIANLVEKYRSQIGNPDEVIYTFENSYTKESFTDNIVCPAMVWYVNNNPELFDNTYVYMSSHNTGGVRANVKEGDFTRRDLFKVFPFDNDLCLQTCNAYNVNQQKASSYYRTYDIGIEYDEKGLTHVISITYIAEYYLAYRYQQSYIRYEKTAKDALVAYLTSGLNVEP